MCQPVFYLVKLGGVGHCVFARSHKLGQPAVLIGQPVKLLGKRHHLMLLLFGAPAHR
jgi:hypothetical protein